MQAFEISLVYVPKSFLRQMGRGNCSNQQALEPKKKIVKLKTVSSHSTNSTSSKREQQEILMKRDNLSAKKSGNAIVPFFKGAAKCTIFAISLAMEYGDGLSPSV